VDAALDGIDAVFHFAAAVGAGQGTFDVARCTSVNNVGTAVVMERVAARKVRRVVVASSMSIYGEGLSRDVTGRVRDTVRGRSSAQLLRGDWEVTDEDGHALVPVPTTEAKAPMLESIYALSKYDQERMCLMLGRTNGIPTTALRFFNVFGPRQAPSNPYTGALTRFVSSLLDDASPILSEDGHQQRDFVGVKDVAKACRLALEGDRSAGLSLNIGSGVPRTFHEVARTLAEVLGKTRRPPEVSGRCRPDDVRHCFADISLAHRILGYEPQVNFAEGLAELAEWFVKDVLARAPSGTRSNGASLPCA
jgi:dTDP-L-rhamnose 4-epimerase